MGIKGDVARKSMKFLLDFQVEPVGNNRLEVVAFVDKKTEECETHARASLTGHRLGNLTIEEAVCIEVDRYILIFFSLFSQIHENIKTYFFSRDITQNEVLILRESEDDLYLYYTEDARKV